MAETKETLVVYKEEMCLKTDENIEVNQLSIIEGSLLLGKNSSVTAASAELNGGLLDSALGTASVRSLYVRGTGNRIIGFVDPVGVSTINVTAGSDFTVDKNLYDAMLVWENFTADGNVIVAKASGNTLSQKDLQLLSTVKSVHWVTFVQDLCEIKKLTFQSDDVLKIGFNNAYGTKKSDKIVIKPHAVIELGTASYTMDLAEGKNSIQIKAAASFTLNSALKNIASIKIDKGDSQKYTFASFSSVEFSEKYSGSLSIGKYAEVSCGNMTSAGKECSISIGSASSFSAGSISNVKKLQLSAGKEKNTKLKAGDIAAYNKLNLSAGNYSEVEAGNISAGLNADQIKIGNYCTFSADTVSFSEGRNKLTSGKNCGIQTANILCGSDKDQLSIGENSVFHADLADLSGGNDKVTIGKNGQFYAKSLNFGEGWDKFEAKTGALVSINRIEYGYAEIKLGKKAELIVRASANPGMISVSANKTSEIYAEKTFYDYLVSGGAGKLKNTLFCIGDAAAAGHFTTFADESSDNTFAEARTLSGSQYDGWLCSEAPLDTIDFFERGTVNSVTGNSENLILTQYDSFGTQVGNASLFQGEILLDASTVKFSVSFDGIPSKSEPVAYTMQLA